MEDETDRDMQRNRKVNEAVRPLFDVELVRDVVDVKKYRDLIESRPPVLEIIKKRKLVV